MFQGVKFRTISVVAPGQRSVVAPEQRSAVAHGQRSVVAPEQRSVVAPGQRSVVAPMKRSCLLLFFMIYLFSPVTSNLSSPQETINK